MRVIAAIFLSLSVIVQLGIAQTADPGAGVPPLSPMVQLGPYLSLNMANSNIVITIPVRSKGGKIPFSYGIVGNSHMYVGEPGGVWTPTMLASGAATASSLWGIIPNGTAFGFAGAELSGNLGISNLSAPHKSTGSCSSQFDTIYSGFQFNDAPRFSTHFSQFIAVGYRRLLPFRERYHCRRLRLYAAVWDLEQRPNHDEHL